MDDFRSFVLRSVWLVYPVVLATSCSDRNPAGVPRRSSGVRTTLLAAADSAAFLASRTTGGTNTVQASGVAEMFGGDRVTITITSAECSGSGDVLAVSGPVSGTVSTDACFDVGRSIDLGPAAASGGLFFTLTDPRYGTGPFEVTGSYPNYTVNCEDGYGDLDFNDNILSVVVTPDQCNLFGSNPTGDALLDDPAVQEDLKHLWGHSDPTASAQADRHEQGGYIVNRNGQREIVEFSSNSPAAICGSTIDPVDMQAIQQSGGIIEGFVHTHPHTPGARVPDPSCPGYSDPTARFGDGPSLKDERAMDASSWPGYVMDKNHVHRMDPHHQAGDPVTKFNRDSNCAKG